jgi:hypothetical protein
MLNVKQSLTFTEDNDQSGSSNKRTKKGNFVAAANPMASCASASTGE